jgi:hypothetical protein
MSAVLLLVERLEQLALHEHLDEPEALTRMVAEREGLIRELSTADLTALSAEERDEFRVRVSELLERNTLMIELVASRQEENRQALEQLRSSRRATNGYAQALNDSSPPPAARRFG